MITEDWNWRARQDETGHSYVSGCFECFVKTPAEGAEPLSPLLSWHDYDWSTCSICSLFIRPPLTVIADKAAPISSRSSEVSATSTAPTFSLRWSKLRVPGIGTIHGFCAITQASAI